MKHILFLAPILVLVACSTISLPSTPEGGATENPIGPTVTPSLTATTDPLAEQEIDFLLTTLQTKEPGLYAIARNDHGFNHIEELTDVIRSDPQVFLELADGDTNYARSLLHVFQGMASATIFSDPNLVPFPIQDPWVVSADSFMLNGGPEFLDAATRGYEFLIYEDTNPNDFLVGINDTQIQEGLAYGDGFPETDFLFGTAIALQMQWSLKHELLVPVISEDPNWKPGQIDTVAAASIGLNVPQGLQYIPEDRVSDYLVGRAFPVASFTQRSFQPSEWSTGQCLGPLPKFDTSWIGYRWAAGEFDYLLAFPKDPNDVAYVTGNHPDMNPLRVEILVGKNLWSYYQFHELLWNDFLKNTNEYDYLLGPDGKISANFYDLNGPFSGFQSPLFNYSYLAPAGTVVDPAQVKNTQQAALTQMLTTGDAGGQINQVAIASLYQINDISSGCHLDGMLSGMNPFYASSILNQSLGLDGATAMMTADSIWLSQPPGAPELHFAPLIEYAFRLEPSNGVSGNYATPYFLTDTGLSVGKDPFAIKSTSGLDVPMNVFFVPNMFSNNGFLYEALPLTPNPTP